MEQMLEQGHKGGASQVESRGSMLWEVGQQEQGKTWSQERSGGCIQKS